MSSKNLFSIIGGRVSRIMVLKILKLILLVGVVGVILVLVVLAYFSYIKLELAAIIVALTLGILGIFQDLVGHSFGIQSWILNLMLLLQIAIKLL